MSRCILRAPVGPVDLERYALREGALIRLVDERHGLAVEQRSGPSAALESAAAVLIPPAVSLHHSIDGDLRGGRQFHDRGSFSLVWSSFGTNGPPHRTHRSSPLREVAA